ncbi:hypothetical protein MMU57_23340, partial [Escherichia coli]|nr:hypothetical protein [Escherichia coli]
MLIGYMRVSSNDERQSVSLQRDALIAAGVDPRHLHQDHASGARDGTVAKLAMRQPFVLFKGLTFQKLCLPGAFRPGDHHN